LKSIKYFIATLFILTIHLNAKTDKLAEADSLVLPEKFKYNVFAENVGSAAKITVNDNGDVYVMLTNLVDGKAIVALRDADGDGQAEDIQYFGNRKGTGIQAYNGYLYYSTERFIARYKLDGELVPTAASEYVVLGLNGHIREFDLEHLNPEKSFTICPDGNLYVNIGAPDNACQVYAGRVESEGVDPCPYLDFFAGIWLFDALLPDQHFDLDAYHYATGIRHCAALRWNEKIHDLFGVQQGRDRLSDLWPHKYSKDQNALLPAEEFLRIKDGNNFGWPYCYYDPDFEHRVLCPEFGGDGEIVGKCDQFDSPVKAFPAHSGAVDLLFYTGDNFPERYQDGAFIAFSGGEAIAPYPQRDYHIAFLPINGDTLATETEVFIKGFANVKKIYGDRDARYRPAGLAQGTAGELYVTDSKIGRIWRITYKK